MPNCRISSLNLVAAVACIAGFLAPAAVSAAPEPYNRIYLETSIAASPTAQTEIETLEEAALTLDVAGGSVEVGANENFQSIRAFDLADASSDGASLLTLTNTNASGCDGVAPCPQSISVENGYLTLADLGLLYRPKGLLAPANELLFLVQAFGGRAQGEPSQLSFEAVLAKPNSLTLADLMGTYRIASYSNERERNVIGDTAEAASTNQITLSFGGDGSCTAGSTGSSTILQETNWPQFDSRSSVFAERSASDAFPGCSYAVDAGAGTVTANLEISDGGDTFMVPLTFFVSSEKRYLAGRLLTNREESGATVETDLNMFIGARVGSAPIANSDLTGIYLMSSFGEVFSGGESFGLDSDFVTRTSLSFNGGAPDADGFSGCTLLGRGYAAASRSLGGGAPNPSPATLAFVGDDATPFNSCRYRADSATSATLELVASNGTSTSIELGVSDDRETLLGVGVATSEDPLPIDIDIELVVPSLAVSELFVLQRYAGQATDFAVTDFSSAIVPSINPGVLLAASVLPGSRSVEQGQTATAFASVINFGGEDGLGCDIRYAGGRSLNFTYQETLATNAPTGEPNVGVDIAAGTTQTYFFGITPLEAFSSEEIELTFSCLNSASALPIVGLNTLLLSSTLSPGPDIVALGATVSNDGIARLPNRSGFFSLASFNVGVQDNMTVSADTGGVDLPVTVTLCQSNPATGACVNPSVPSSDPVSLSIEGGGTPTFAVFVNASEDIALDPANKRIFVRFNDSTGVVRGSTSVAVQTE